MDYHRQPLSFRVRKVLRYVGMYGISRTLIKVKGRRHMRRTFAPLPPSSRDIPPGRCIGIIGCGNYAFGNIAYYLRSEFGAVIGACMDVVADRAASLAGEYGAPLHTTDAEEVIAHPAITTLFIASNHASHTDYAIRALGLGKDVYIEKPHVVSFDQLDRLAAAIRAGRGRVHLGFNRPDSRLGYLAREALAAQSGPGVYSWFVAGHAIEPGHWYHHPAEGGRVCGNLCHWTDFILRLPIDPVFPVTITPMRGERVDCDLCVSYRFAGGTLATITFSEKGEPFEGVMERFCGHRGDCLAYLDDFTTLTLNIGERRTVHRNRHRDHGHRANIVRLVREARSGVAVDHERTLWHILNTAWLYLKTKQALEENRVLTVHPYGEGAPA